MKRKTTAKAYLSNCDCSIPEAVHRILPDVNLRRIFWAVYFVDTNLPQERFPVLFKTLVYHWPTENYWPAGR